RRSRGRASSSSFPPSCAARLCRCRSCSRYISAIQTRRHRRGIPFSRRTPRAPIVRRRVPRNRQRQNVAVPGKQAQKNRDSSNMSIKRNERPYDNVLETIGWTPLIRLHRVTRGIRTPVYGKAEFFNPGGSVKDRIGLPIIERAEREGKLKPGGTIVEGTSGNTGVGLALAAALRGYKCIFTLPDKMSQEKVRLLKA